MARESMSIGLLPNGWKPDADIRASSGYEQLESIYDNDALRITSSDFAPSTEGFTASGLRKTRVTRNKIIEENAMLNALQTSTLSGFLRRRAAEDKTTRRAHRRAITWYAIQVLAPMLVAGIVLLQGRNIDDKVSVSRCMAVIVLVAGWWLLAPFPDFGASIAPVFLFPLAGIMTTSEVASSYFNDTIFLMIGASLVNLCIDESGLAERVGLLGLRAFTSSSGSIKPVIVILAFMLVSGSMSMM